MLPKYSYLTAGIFLLFFFSLNAQLNLDYQEPPKNIVDLVDAPNTPLASVSSNGDKLLLLNVPNYATIEEVASEELRLAGLRIDPVTNGPSRSRYYTQMKLKSISGQEAQEIEGLPEKLRAGNLSWSASGKRVAFTNTSSAGVELWMVDIETLKAKKLTKATLNAAMRGTPFRWFSDGRFIIFKSIEATRGAKPSRPATPSGPIVQENYGAEAAVRTYQDLLQNYYDVQLFDYYTTSQLKVIDVETGEARDFGSAGVISGFTPSPDGNYVLVTRLEKPYSYLVPYYRFPQEVEIFDRSGKKQKTLASIPLAESIPKGFGAVREGPRSFTWRNDAPASVYWVEAIDGGDPKAEVEYRDQMYYLSAPFEAQAQEGLRFQLRYGGITWGDDQMAMASEYWWSTRREIISKWNPAEPKSSKSILFDRSREDRYNDPGSFVTTTNEFGRRVLLMGENPDHLFLIGTGASPEGNRPFVDQYRVSTGKTDRLWRSEAPYYEYPISIIDPVKGSVLTRRESKEEPPNYFLRNFKEGKMEQVTSFENPYKSLQGVSKELVRYEREDGVQLTGTLYLPAGYDKEKDGRLPVFMWAYPREFKSAKAAGQVSGSPHQFIRMYYGSPIFWVTQGYAVFDNFAMPIIGEEDEEPNETFVEQLRMGAEAAVNKLVDMGIADRDRLAVGGHSYGAFMTANLLAHTDLFAAGVARSGAYNRTLTPFGFQREERTFWEAPEVYFKMSPFMHADKIKEPVLLIHGEADNNSGTFPLQSKRFYAALKGHGAIARLVMLPHESHGYRARESILHMLYEMNTWMDKHVKNKKKTQMIKP